MRNTILPSSLNQGLIASAVDEAKKQLRKSGWVLLRGFDMDVKRFSTVLQKLCCHITYDPARNFGADHIQTVDAGRDPVGLHIENGNAPITPDIVAFYSYKSAARGSQTTICDGVDIYEHMSERLKKLFSQSITVSRNIPSPLWRQYVSSELDGAVQPKQVTQKHLDILISRCLGQQVTVRSDDSVDFTRKVDPVIRGAYSNRRAFANAILGPSFSYQKPTYRFNNGESIDKNMREELEKISEPWTHEISWQDGDVILIDNKRVMHGRREIKGDLSQRQLFIGMGSL